MKYCKVILHLLFIFAVVSVNHSKKIVRKNFQPTSRSGLQNRHDRLGVYFGITTSIEKHPYMAGVVVSEEFWCAATIVSQKWVMTLADCVVGQSKSDIEIVVGSNNGQDNGTSYAVKRIVTHPDYDENLDYDYSLVEVKGSFAWGDTVRPIYLPSAEPETRSRLTVSGYGDTTEDVQGDGTNTQIHEGVMRWQTRSFCKSYFDGDGLTVTDRMACAYNKGRVTMCDGDYGDPFVKNNTFYGFFISGLEDGWCTYQAGPVLLATVFPVAAWVSNTTGASYQ